MKVKLSKLILGSQTSSKNLEIIKYFLRLEKKVAFVFFVVKSLSNLGKSMSITKLIAKISFEIFPDFEVS